MAFPQESANAEPRKEARSENEERAPSCYHSSSSDMSSSYEDAYERANSRRHVDGAAAMGRQPPPAQQMNRQPSGAAADGDPGRIPAAVFERDPSGSNKDWSMMSTDSVFALQVAPSSDFTGFFLAHPELMDISTPPRTSDVAADEAVLAPHFESIPGLGEATMSGNHSFAFPNLIEDKRYSSKKAQEQPSSPPSPAMAATTTVTAEAAPAEADTSSKPEVAPAKAAAKGGLLSCFPCCSS